MLKIKELIKSFKEINVTLKEINNSLQENKKRTEISIDRNYATISEIYDWKNSVETNVYTKEETIKVINKEHEYIEDFRECKEENKALLELIETYCKFKDKYEIIKLFNKINEEYEVKNRT